MRKLLILLAALLIWGANGALADTIFLRDNPLPQIHPPSSQLAYLPFEAAPFGPTAATFTGMGDTLSGAKAHFGSIAYSAAQRGHKVYSICDNATHGSGTCKDISTDASTGIVSNTQGVGTITTCDNSSHQCYVDALYDDSGTNSCNSATASCDLCPGGGTCAGTRIKFIISAIGSIPGFDPSTSGTTYNGQAGHILTTQTGGGALLASFKPTVAITSTDNFFSIGGFSGLFFVMDSGSSSTIYKHNNSGTSVNTLLASGTSYALIGTDDNAANGHLSINGTVTAVTTGTGNWSVSTGILVGNISAGTTSAMNVIELGVYATNVNSSISALNSTMRTNGGF